jgi:hypothetical protein
MSNPLAKIAPPPRRANVAEHEPVPSAAPVTAAKFSQVKEDERVQFNKRVTRQVADGFEMLAIRTRKRVPDLLAEALAVLEERYGKIG